MAFYNGDTIKCKTVITPLQCMPFVRTDLCRKGVASHLINRGTCLVHYDSSSRHRSQVVSIGPFSSKRVEFALPPLADEDISSRSANYPLGRPSNKITGGLGGAVPLGAPFSGCCNASPKHSLALPLALVSSPMSSPKGWCQRPNAQE